MEGFFSIEEMHLKRLTLFCDYIAAMVKIYANICRNRNKNSLEKIKTLDLS